MASKRRRRTRGMRPTIRPEVWAILCDERSDDDASRWIALTIPGDPTDTRGDEYGLLDAWRTHCDEIVEEWARTRPGTRPSLWWSLSGAPRQPKGRFPGRWYDGHKPEPRKRLGGTGRPIWERYPAIVPYWPFGIPMSWDDIDSNHPPVYEAQARYLERHGLLLPGERRRLSDADFEPETVTVDKERRA